MLFVDVSILVFAHRSDTRQHDACRRWLEQARVGHEPLALADQVLAGFVRVVTHPRIFKEPSPPDVAVEFADSLRASPAAVSVVPSERTWTIFRDLVASTGSKGNGVPDAYLAALSIDHGATFCTGDRSFARFPGLRVFHPG